MSDHKERWGWPESASPAPMASPDNEVFQAIGGPMERRVLWGLRVRLGKTALWVFVVLWDLQARLVWLVRLALWALLGKMLTQRRSQQPSKTPLPSNLP